MKSIIPLNILSNPRFYNANGTNRFILLTFLAISTIVITYLPTQTSIVILCDSDNHLHKISANKQLNKFNRQDVYFQISDPENLRYTFKARSSRIGVPFNETLTNIALVSAEPRDACTSIINKLEIKNNVALVGRGGCTFVEKCIEIERSGGIALMVYDYDKHNDENYIEMVDDNTSRNCSIPAISLLGRDGDMIVRALQALKLSRAIVTILVNQTVDKGLIPPWLKW